MRFLRFFLVAAFFLPAIVSAQTLPPGVALPPGVVLPPGLAASSSTTMAPAQPTAPKPLIEQLPPLKSSSAPKVGAEAEVAPPPPPKANAEESKIEKLINSAVSTELDTRIEQFGYHVFNQSVTTFAPTNNAPVGPDYIIGPGDSFRIDVWGKVNLSHELTIDRAGTIFLPQIGSLNVWGLTVEQLRTKINNTIANFYTGFEFSLTFTNLRTITVYVMGESRTPGAYQISSLSTMFNALFSAGGATKMGSLRDVQLIRNGKTVARLDIYDFLLRGNKTSDHKLVSGDTIFIPPVKTTIGIQGHVQRPAIYEFKEDSTTLAQLINTAGGFRKTGYLGKIQVVRTQKHEYQTVLDIKIEEKDVRDSLASDGMVRTGSKIFDFRVEAGDLIKIFPILPGKRGIVALSGHVVRPGEYQFKPGMKLSDLVKGISSLRADPFLKYATIARTEAPFSTKKIVSFSLEALINGLPEADLVLQDQDIVTVFSAADVVHTKIVTIRGAVKNPGVFPYVANMKVRDLLFAAGGVNPDVYYGYAYIERSSVPYGVEKEVHRFAVGKVVAGDESDNLSLQEGDDLRIFSNAEFEQTGTVSVLGEVRKPGALKFLSGMKLTDALLQAGNPLPTAYLDYAIIERDDPPFRNERKLISVNVRNIMEGKDEDPKLMHLDAVTIYSVGQMSHPSVVYIFGRVKSPGPKAFSEGMTVKDLVFMAGSVTRDAYLESVEIVRKEYSQQGTSETRVPVCLAKALAGDPAHNIKLQRFDQVFIRQIPNWYESLTITLNGEVRFPGIYAIRKGERLADVLTRAGGFTQYAYLPAAVFTRETVKTVQQQRLNDYTMRQQEAITREQSKLGEISLDTQQQEMAKRNIEAKQVILKQMMEARVTGRIVIKLENLSSFSSSPHNLLVESGDALTVPTRPDFVTIIGEVYNPNAVLFEEGEDVEHYLDLVGGITDDADDGTLFVVRADGSVISQRNHDGIIFGRFLGRELMPGDAILVPRDFSFLNILGVVKDVSTILFQLATTAGVVLQVTGVGQ